MIPAVEKNYKIFDIFLNFTLNYMFIVIIIINYYNYIIIIK